MNFLKKQTISSWVTLLALILSIISSIIYGANVGGAGYFNGMSNSTIVTASVFEVILLAVILVLSQIQFNGLIGWVEGIVLSAIKIVTVFLPVFALLAFVNTRIEGLAYIFFSNEDVLATIQTAENLSSANTAIVGFVFYGITTVVAAVAAFFRPFKAVKAAKATA